jgi:hypothetical protein
MSETRTFFASSTVTVNALLHDLWAMWVDVNAWDSWDSSIDSTEMRENFKAGTTFVLTPKGAEPTRVTITTVSQGEEFSDEAVLPFGTIRKSHRLEPFGELVKVTHEIEAEINSDHAPLFSKSVWPGMQLNLSESLNEMIDIARTD